MVLVCTAAFMLLLDIAIVSVALPSIQRDLRGRGKRHTVRYLLRHGRRNGHRSVRRRTGRIGEACKVARALQPSAVIEDVDLIGEERLPRMGPVMGTIRGLWPRIFVPGRRRRTRLG